ncbi:hypothetical protein [Mesorhizobium qingshengii]|uniref:hypothetical protein n=1 Tax=Mesorhizobium qingshengii TaxID=1165689 RepID=UPI00115FC21D|nr:hypothetical protein [Mesorhizobium qingshengii]
MRVFARAPPDPSHLSILPIPPWIEPQPFKVIKKRLRGCGIAEAMEPIGFISAVGPYRLNMPRLVLKPWQNVAIMVKFLSVQRSSGSATWCGQSRSMTDGVGEARLRLTTIRNASTDLGALIKRRGPYYAISGSVRIFVSLRWTSKSSHSDQANACIRLSS